MDKVEIIQLQHLISTTIREQMEGATEQWVTGKELSKQFQCFTPNWLKHFGETLPRTQAVVKDADGIEHGSMWIYPRNKIGAMVADGRIKSLRMK